MDISFFDAKPLHLLMDLNAVCNEDDDDQHLKMFPSIEE